MIIYIQNHDQTFFIIIRFGLNVALTHKNRSYRDSETKENGSGEGKTTGRLQRQLKINTTKKAYNMCRLE